MLRIIDIDQAGELLSRNNSRLDLAIETVKPIIDDVRLRGDAALFEYAKKFDDFDGSSFAVKTGGKLSAELLNAVEVAAANIRAFLSRNYRGTITSHHQMVGQWVKWYERLIRLAFMCQQVVIH